MTRRALLRTAILSPGAALAGLRAGPNILSMTRRPTDIRVEDISSSYEDFSYRAPIKFGGRVVDRTTLVNVNCVIYTVSGKVAKGFGSMTLGNVWSFPSSVMSYDTTLGAMKALADRIAKITANYKEPGHPIDINFALEPEYLKAAVEISRTMKLAEPIPKLCTLVTASAFDAAIHDAFGKVHGLNCFRAYGPEFMTHDLAHYLGPGFEGEYPNQYLLKDPKPRLPVYHLVGALDPILEPDIRRRINDGLPETLPEWIRYNGITHIKIKLNGNDMGWDIDRVLRVDRATTETEKKRGVDRWVYSLDFNEKCPNVGYLLDFLAQLKERSPAGFRRIQYVEQPTARDLKSHRSNVMHAAAKIVPVVIDESLTDFENLMLARELGYSGAALKACKGQSQSMLMAAAGQKFKMFLCVQDLTCPGASLIQSAGIAAYVPNVPAIEANARQYVPDANKPWENKFPGIFHITDGTMDTAALTQPGLSATSG